MASKKTEEELELAVIVEATSNKSDAAGKSNTVTKPKQTDGNTKSSSTAPSTREAQTAGQPKRRPKHQSKPHGKPRGDGKARGQGRYSANRMRFGPRGRSAVKAGSSQRVTSPRPRRNSVQWDILCDLFLIAIVNNVFTHGVAAAESSDYELLLTTYIQFGTLVLLWLESVCFLFVVFVVFHLFLNFLMLDA